MYEARIPASHLRSPNKRSIHIYYCISGVGKCTTKNGTQHKVCPDTVVALSSDVAYDMTVSAEGAMRLFVAYYPDINVAYRSLALVRSLSELVGTERDIDWGQGHSRRFLIKQDGFPIGVHNTWVHPKTSSRLGYQNHNESVYYISGSVTYRWKDTSGEWIHENTKTDKEDGTNYLMNIHDPHVMEIHDEDAYYICIFDPVLTGNENHQFTEDGFSGYDA